MGGQDVGLQRMGPGAGPCWCVLTPEIWIGADWLYATDEDAVRPLRLVEGESNFPEMDANVNAPGAVLEDYPGQVVAPLSECLMCRRERGLVRVADSQRCSGRRGRRLRKFSQAPTRRGRRDGARCQLRQRLAYRPKRILNLSQLGKTILVTCTIASFFENKRGLGLRAQTPRSSEPYINGRRRPRNRQAHQPE